MEDCLHETEHLARRVSATPPATLVLHGASVLDEQGSFVDGLTVVVEHGVVRSVGPRPTSTPRDAEHVDLAGHWLMPGVVDCHSHVFWNEFHAADRDTVPLTYRTLAATRSLGETLRAGVTSVRDAGGADRGVRDAVRDGVIAGPRLQIADWILGPDDSAHSKDPGAPDRLRRRVREVVARGAEWIKLMATGGVTAPEGSELDSFFTAEEFRAAVDEAARGGARVMVHAWGGDAVTWAIDAGAASIEHGIFLTDEQAAAGARARVTLVPTLTIYAEVHAMALAGALPDFVAERTARVAEAHPLAVRRARDAGMAVALGSDFGTPEQHGRNLAEIAALAEAGLGTEAALLAATRTGASLLGATGILGSITPGATFDALALRRDPSEVAVFRDRESVAHVWQGGVSVSR